ncbi:IclR family transcriptional regulator [Halocatena marina]|uniref:IclR family transcriptional regulator n=1 Tax=Halocatena marina TaxID=2934937 RepID=A0ABD5YZQ1_9EURY
MKILKLLSEADGARVAEIAEQMDAPTSTIHGHLATLEAEQFVFKRGGIYFLGSELLRLGSKVRTRREEFIQAREFTKKLFDEIGFRSIFVIEMAGRAVFIHTASGSKMRWTHENLGNRLYLHNTAVGKAILAEHPSPGWNKFLTSGGCHRKLSARSLTVRSCLVS